MNLRENLDELPTVSGILKRVPDSVLFSFYLGQDVGRLIGRTIKSPLETASRASFSIYLAKDRIRFKDHSKGTKGDVFDFIKAKFGESLSDACFRINRDFDLGFQESEISRPKTKHGYSGEVSPIDYQVPADIRIVTRSWDKAHLGYWLRYGIDREMLEMARIVPLYRAEKNGFNLALGTSRDPLYAYLFSDSKLKIYRPLTRNRSQRFFSSPQVNDIICGEHMLPPEGGPLVVITKSYKDVLCIIKHLGIPAVCPASESIVWSEETFSRLSHFRNKLVLMDFDRTGVQSAQKYRKRHGTHWDFLQNLSNRNNGLKDVSDHYARKVRLPDHFIEKLKSLNSS